MLLCVYIYIYIYILEKTTWINSDRTFWNVNNEYIQNRSEIIKDNVQEGDTEDIEGNLRRDKVFVFI